MGDHYASIMFRGIITYNTDTSNNVEKTLLIKTMPFVDGHKKEMLTGMGLFKTEIKMYSEIIPMFEQLLRSIGDQTELGAKCLYTAMEPQEILIFEDLTKRNYAGIEKRSGNWVIAQKALEKLAKWHAISYKLVKEGNTELLNFTESFYGSEKMAEMPMYRDGFKSFIEMLKRNPEFEIYVPKFEKLLANDPIKQGQKMFRAAANGAESLFVLNHGDYHIKNCMFTKKVNSEIDDVMLVDFQICLWGPAAFDLICAFYTFLDKDTRIDRRDELVYHYFSTFTEILEKLEFIGTFPKLTDLHKDLISYKDYGEFKI